MMFKGQIEPPYTHARETIFLCYTFAFIFTEVIFGATCTNILWGKLYSCEVSCSSFSLNSLLRANMWRYNREKHSCKVLVFPLQRNHILLGKETQTGVKPHFGEVCGSSFSFMSSFKKHTEEHTGMKPHSCKECGSSFSCKPSLVWHMQSHTGEKPYLLVKFVALLFHRRQVW